MKIQTQDKITLEAIKLTPKQTPTKAQIFLTHGYSVPKEGPADILKETAEALAENGFEVIYFDFRGHGKSTGESSDVTLDSGLLDLDAVFRATHNSKLSVGFLGFSYGATVAIKYITDNHITAFATVFFSPALDLIKGALEYENSLLGKFAREAVTNNQTEFVLPHNGFRGSLNLFDSFKNYKPAEDLKVVPNTLILQGKNDQMLDFNLMKSLGEPAVDKYLVLDTVHGLTEEKPRAIKEAVDWFSSHI